MADCNCLKEASVVNINCEYCTVEETAGCGCTSVTPDCGCGNDRPMTIDAGSGWTCERCVPTPPATNMGCGCGHAPTPIYMGCGCGAPMTSCCGGGPVSIIPECGSGCGCGCK